MTPFAHLSGGYLVTQIADLINPAWGFNRPEVIVSSLIGANLPDFDVFIVGGLKDHRNTITHAPLFWIALFAFFYPASILIGNSFITINLISFFLGLFTHFLFDWYAAREKDHGGIRLFYPFSKKHFGFHKLIDMPKYMLGKVDFKKFIKFYSADKLLFYTEISLIAIAIVVFLIRFPGYWHYFFK